MADGGAPSSSTSNGKIHFSAAEAATLVLEGSDLESIDSLDGWESDDCARGDISLLLSCVLTDNNNVSYDCVSPAILDQTGDCTSDIEEEIAAVSSADEELISDDEEALDFLPTVWCKRRATRTTRSRPKRGEWGVASGRGRRRGRGGAAAAPATHAAFQGKFSPPNH